MDMILSVIVLLAALSVSVAQSRAIKQKSRSVKPPVKVGAGGADPASLEARRKHLQELEAMRQRQRETQKAQPAAKAAQANARPGLRVTPHTDDIFNGSMNYQTTEGEDPCHEPQLAPAVHPCELAPQPSAPAKAGLRLEWTGDAMVKAVVMQEILTRPCDRARR